MAESTPEWVVCWREPVSLPAGAAVLSFLPVAREEMLRRQHDGIVVSAREASQVSRRTMQQLYLDLIASVGVATDGDGRTLRERVGTVSGTSRWWFHPVSFRDCESDLAYDRLLAIETIRRNAGHAKPLRLVGAPADVAAVLATGHAVVEEATQAPASRAKMVVRSLLSRVRMANREVRHITAARVFAVEARFDVVLSAFWDWSIRCDQGRGLFVDRYFGQLADRLRSEGARVSAIAWLDPDSEPGKKNRPIVEVLRPLAGQSGIAILQRELHPRDAVAAYTDFSPLRAYQAFRATKSFRQRFVLEGIDYFPIVDLQLTRGFVGSSIPNCELVCKATARAFARHTPEAFVSFLEHFPHARAQYAAARAANVRSWTIQHAGYCHEKTFLILDVKREMSGEPEGLSCPHPDAVCAAGELGRKMFLESGYLPDAVAVTGSPRYDHLRVRQAGVMKRRSRPRILLAATLAVGPELDMIEAVVAAADSTINAELVLRNHPFRRIDKEARFQPFQGKVAVSTETLEVDLETADLIIFTYSTVADEAFLIGKSVWQWLPAGFNGSALAEVWPIPQFGTVSALREALIVGCRDGFPKPDPLVQQQVAKELFGPCDGGAALRVAQAVTGRIAERSLAAKDGIV